jgi:hypothetical protein
MRQQDELSNVRKDDGQDPSSSWHTARIHPSAAQTSKKAIVMKIIARVTKHGRDPLGRYVWQEILLDGERTLMIVTAYRVVQRQTKGCGPTTSMMQ